MGFGKKKSNKVTGTSKDFVRGLVAICEGVVEGFPGGAQDVKLNGTPLQNADLSFNFEDFIFELRTGTSTQEPFPTGIGEVSIENTVNQAVTKVISVTQTVVNAEMTALRVRLAVQLDKKGKQESVRLKIFIKEGAGAFIEVTDQTIKGRYPAFTVFQYVFQVDPTVDQYSVRVEKVSADIAPGDTSGSVRDLQWLTLTELTQTQIAYINTAVMYYNFNSELFTSDPDIGLLLAGSIFQVPANATIAANRNDRGLTFNAGWNGTFYTPALATTDPAWAVWALLTRSRENGGLGFSPSDINKFDLYSCSVHNNELISNGFGGTERRYSFNGLITQQQQTLETIRAICATFATKPYWDGLQLCFWQQKTVTAIPKILSNADVKDGLFTMSQGEYQAITTACKVWYTNPSNEYENSPELVEIPESIARYGYFQEEFTALGVISRGAAIRAGRRVCYSSLPRYNKQISFDCRPYAVYFKPGEVVQIADYGRNRQRKAGLVISATLDTVTLDAQVNITNDPIRTIFLTLTSSGIIYTEQRNITNAIGFTNLITFSPSLPSLPEIHSTWMIVDGAVPIYQYQILAIEPNKENPLFYSITGKSYASDLEGRIENGWKIEPLPLPPQAPAVIAPPANLTIEIKNGADLDISWDQTSPYASSYIVETRASLDDEWGDRQEVTSTSLYEVDGALEAGGYYIQVATVGTNGVVSAWVETFVEQTDPPSQPLVRRTETITITDTILPGENYTISAALNVSLFLLKVTCLVPIRLRIYYSAAARLVDLNRGAEFINYPNNGLLTECYPAPVYNANPATLMYSIVGGDTEYFATITNLGGASISNFAIVFEYLPLEI